MPLSVRMRGQGSLEYLLLIGGGVLVAVVIISAVLSIPQTAGGSNEYGVATAQCLAYPNEPLCTGKKVTINQNEYYCAWNPSEGKCLAQQIACQFAAPTNPIYNNPVGAPINVTVQYAGFAGTPTGTVNCPNGGQGFSCDQGTCTAANCAEFAQAQSQLTASLTDGTNNQNCNPNPYHFIIQYCGDDAIQLPQEECDGDELGGNDCTTIGHDGGTLGCNQTGCTFNTDNCCDNEEYSGVECVAGRSVCIGNSSYACVENQQGCFEASGLGQDCGTGTCNPSTGLCEGGSGGGAAA